jgi:hypothetical protein
MQAGQLHGTAGISFDKVYSGAVQRSKAQALSDQQLAYGLHAIR